MNDWVSVKDSLPTNSSLILASAGHGWFLATYYNHSWSPMEGFDKRKPGGFYTYREGKMERVDGVTHWLPIPAPPEVGE